MNDCEHWIKIGFFSLCWPTKNIADSIHRKNESHSNDYYDDNNNRQIKLTCVCYWVDVFAILYHFLDSIFIHNMSEIRMNRIQNQRDPQMAQPRQREKKPLSSTRSTIQYFASQNKKSQESQYFHVLMYYKSNIVGARIHSQRKSIFNNKISKQ